MNYEPDKTKGTLYTGETHINNISDDAEGVPSGVSFEESTLAHSSKMSSSHSSEEEPPAHLNDEDKKDDSPIPEKKFRISVRKFLPEELNLPESSEVATTDYSRLVLPFEGPNNDPDSGHFQDDYNQPCSSGLGKYSNVTDFTVSLQLGPNEIDTDPCIEDPTIPLEFDDNEMDTVLAFINLILLKRGAYSNSPNEVTFLINDLMRTIKGNLDSLCLTDQLRKKMNTFCEKMGLMCQLSVQQLDSTQGVNPFLLEYAKVAQYCYQYQNLENFESKKHTKQEILACIDTCKEHLDDLKLAVDESIKRQSLKQSLVLKGKNENAKDGTSNVVIDLDDISDDEELPIVLPPGVSVYVSEIESVLPFDVISKLFEALSPRGNPRTQESSSSSYINETLIYKASDEISCLNVSENLLVIGFITGKVIFINLLNNEVIEEKIQEHCSVITFIEIWEKKILTVCDQYIRCLSLDKNFKKLVFLDDFITAMSIYAGFLYIGTKTGLYYKLSLPNLNFVGKSLRVCDHSITSISVIKSTQSALVLLGTSSRLLLLNSNLGNVMGTIDMLNLGVLYMTPEFVLIVSEDNIKKASILEIKSKNLTFKHNPWNEGSSGCILNGEEGNVLIGCKNGDIVHFSKDLLFMGKLNRHKWGSIKFLVPWQKKMAVVSDGSSVFYVSTVNPMIKTEPVDIEEHKYMDH